MHWKSWTLQRKIYVQLIHKSEQDFSGLRPAHFSTLMQLSCVYVLVGVHLTWLAFDGILLIFQVMCQLGWVFLSCYRCLCSLIQLFPWKLWYFQQYWPWPQLVFELVIQYISSNDRPFVCPIIYTDIIFTIFFVHWYLEAIGRNICRS